MDTLTVFMEFPKDFIGALNIPEREIGHRFKQLIISELVRNRQISSGKGAELLNMTKAEFINLMAQNDISYFTESPEELAAQVRNMQKMMDN